MALQDIKQPLQWPSMVGFSHLGLTLDNAIINASGYYAGAVFQIPESGDVSSVSVRIGTVFTSSGFLEVRLETVDENTGLPAGTLYHANASAQVEVTGANQLAVATFASDVPVTRGDVVAVLFRWVSGDYSIAVSVNAFIDTLDFPYGLSNLGTGVSKDAIPGPPNFGLIYDDGSAPHIPGLWNMTSRVATTFNSGTGPDEIGAEFVIPFTGRAAYAWSFLDTDGPAIMRLYNNAGATLASTRQLTNGLRRRVVGAPMIWALDNPPTLNAGSTYRLTVIPQSTTNVYIQSVVSPYLDATPLGSDWQFVSRTDGGVWAITAGRSPLIGLIFDQIDAAGGGGIAIHPGMSGGFNA